MSEEKETILVRINTVFKKISDELFNGVDAKTAMDLGAIALFVLGAISLGIGLQFVSAIFIAPGIAMLLLGIGRLIYNCDGFS